MKKEYYPYFIAGGLLAGLCVFAVASHFRGRVVLSSPAKVAETAKAAAGEAFEQLVTAATEVASEPDNTRLLNLEGLPNSMTTDHEKVH